MGSTKGIGLGIVRGLGSTALAVALALSRSDEVRRLAREPIGGLAGTVDTLVNNAGQPRVAPSESLSEADYRYTLDLKPERVLCADPGDRAGHAPGRPRRHHPRVPGGCPWAASGPPRK